VTLPRLGPLPAFHFLVALTDTSSSPLAIAGGIAGMALGGFAECTGLESTLETFDYLEGGVNDRVHRFPTRFSFTNITLKRGVGLGEGLWNWHLEFLQGRGKRRDGLIVLQNEAKLPLKTWTFSRGLPVKWSGPALNASASEVAIESLEIAHEKLELISPGVAAGAALDQVGALF
jgi:phage tail-like protein